MKSWFRDQFLIINSADKTRFLPKIENGSEKENQAFIVKNIDRIAKEAGIIGSHLAYINDTDTHTVKLVSIFKQEPDSAYGTGVDTDEIESQGTLRLVSIMPAVIMAMLELFDNIIETLPLYQLECDISEDAVRCSFEALTGERYISQGLQCTPEEVDEAWRLPRVYS